MDVQAKKEKLLKAIHVKELDDCFRVKETEEGNVLFQVFHEVKNGGFLMTIEINDKEFTPVVFHIAELEDPTEEQEIHMLKLLNDFNNNSILLRYTLDQNGIYADFSYLYSAEYFDAEDLIDWTISAYQEIRENRYAKIMQFVWS
ncbi:MAG: hypothetical protein ACI4XS_15495 [Bacillus sp. (in: firmicutes)]